MSIWHKPDSKSLATFSFAQARLRAVVGDSKWSVVILWTTLLSGQIYSYQEALWVANLNSGMNRLN